MKYVLEIGSVKGTIEAESVEAAYEKLRGLLQQIGMDLGEYEEGGYYVNSKGHDPEVLIYAEKP